MSRDFNKGKIYKITNDHNDDVYVGSTCDILGKRFSRHKIDMKREKYKNIPIYKLMNEIGFERFRIQLIIDYPCEDVYQLTQNEGEYIRLLGTLNKRVEGRTKKEYYKQYSQKPEVKEQRKQYNQKYGQNPERKEYMKQYSQKSEVKKHRKQYQQKPEYKEYMKQYRQKPEVKEYMKQYRQKLEYKENKKEYYESNKNRILEQKKKNINVFVVVKLLIVVYNVI
jgi:hypothetical protein